MAANVDPIYTRIGAIGPVRITAANTSSQGGGTIATDIFLVETAGADGSFIQRLRFIPTATAPTTTTATVARVFLSTVSSGTTSNSNTFLWAEVTLPALAADNATTQIYPIDVPLSLVLPSGYSILVTNHAAPAANTAWVVTAIGGDY
jgi:hypothetical protein